MITVFLLSSLITLKAQNISLFSTATKSEWYRHFLQPVVDAVKDSPAFPHMLDIGTGPGTLPEMVIAQDSTARITGIDIDAAMINEAKRRFTHKNVSFQHQKGNAPLPFDDQHFDIVTFCSVLFLLDDQTKDRLLKEALRIVKPTGKIIILTPSGKKPVLASFGEVGRFGSLIKNGTFPVWRIATSRGGRTWSREQWVKTFAAEHQLNYSATLTFHENALLEIVSKRKLKRA
jgi:ubiquinone/menaquinone biosynthesis C-methylase UbiE